MKEAKISDIFLSLQGEGLYMGVPQLFIRFYGCHLSCIFCDTKLGNSYKTFTKKALLNEISQYKEPYHSLSLTGGEPLLQAEFIRNFLAAYKRRNKKPVYLETNGTLHRALSWIIKYVDIIAMDFKIPSSTKEDSFWEEHEKFLKVAKKKNVFVKTVITSETIAKDIMRVREIVGKMGRKIPVVLQPVTALRSIRETGIEKLNFFRNLLKESIERVDIIPQVHKIIGVK